MSCPDCIPSQIETVEWESHNLEIMKALQGGTAALNAIHAEMSVDDVERLLEESAEAVEMQNEIDRMLTGQFNAEDDLELNSEFEDLMRAANPTAAEPKAEEGAAMRLPDAPSHPVTVFPTVPTGPVTAASDTAAKQETRQAVPS
jgi:charged multivesicular body protein 6